MEVTELKNITTFISSASFEERCFSTIEKISNSKISPVKSLIFYNGNEVKSISGNAVRMASKLQNSRLIELNSNAPTLNYLKIRKIIFKEATEGNLENTLIDITTFTHETLLILLKIFKLINASVKNLYLGYSGAKEYSVSENDDDKKWLSKGIREIRNVIGFPGVYERMRKDHIVIMFGFEYERTVSLIEKYEYDILSLGFCLESTAIRSNHYKINKERHLKLLSRFTNSLQFTFSLKDPLQTQNNILDHISNNDLVEANTVIAPMNNKISTIGAGIAAFNNPRIQLVYAQPLIYNTSNYSIPNGEVYFSKIELGDHSV